MRKIIIARGHPGSGKSHAIKQLGLEDWSISSDVLRTQLASPMFTEDGRFMLDQDVNGLVFSMIKSVSEARMERGDTFVIDSTGMDISDIKKTIELAKEHRYEIAILDMSDIPLEISLERSLNRQESRIVREDSIRKIHDVIKDNPVPESDNVTVIKGDVEGRHIDKMKNWLTVPDWDLSQYNEVCHIGDLQGCYSVLAEGDGPLARGFRDDVFYIFVGDLLDRGIENGKVMRWFVDEALDRDNVALIWGNHEDHLHRWARDKVAVSNEFLRRTLPQLKQSGITREDAENVCSKALEFIRYNYRGKKVVVTHAGLSAWPEKPHLISTKVFKNGRYWTDPIDESFQNNVERNGLDVYQVHGHRNGMQLPVRATERSFNLEDSVEHGGNLRLCRLSEAGWKTECYTNVIYRSLRKRLKLETKMTEMRKQERKSYPHWILNEDEKEDRVSEEFLSLMQAHEGVRERSSERFPHVKSLNFTRKVFYSKSWDDVVIKARGFFYNVNSKQIVSRAYDKFFNVNERDETKIDRLLESVKFPIRVFEKENGFLGNVGYCEENDCLFVSSKSTPDGDFADMFREIFYQTLDEGKREALKRYLRDMEASMTFEVIDPVNDPHMIEYPEPKIVLLDIVRRAQNFETADYDVLTRVAKKFDLPVKKLAMTLKDEKSLAGWYNRAMQDTRRRIEGYVIQDKNGFMTKIKLPYYAFWKRMRSMKDRLVASREKGKDFMFDPEAAFPGGTPMEEEVSLGRAFHEWCTQQDTETLKSDIITLRQMADMDFDRIPVEVPRPAF